MRMYVVGDPEYQVFDVKLVPFTGSQRKDQGKDAFNLFFLLQHQGICIEIAFGLLQTKWWCVVLKRPLLVNLSTTANFIKTFARHHLFSS